jgi:hypothetical protein
VKSTIILGLQELLGKFVVFFRLHIIIVGGSVCLLVMSMQLKHNEGSLMGCRTPCIRNVNFCQIWSQFCKHRLPLFIVIHM